MASSRSAAILKGTDGKCKIDGTDMDVTAWSYDGAIDVVETTPVGSTDKKFEQTTRSGTGSLTISFDAGNAQQKVLVDQLLSSVTLKKILVQLRQDDTNDKQLYFSVVINSISMPEGANVVDVLTVNFTKTGDLYHVPTT